MKILAHRGYWRHLKEQNTIKSFIDAFDRDYGIETDIRDCNGKLVISHDMATNKSPSIEELLNTAKDNQHCPLAINIKSDGLALAIKQSVDEYNIKSSFVFDMSIPDQINHQNVGNKYFSRCSDIEKEPIGWLNATGIWLDSLISEWLTAGFLERLLLKNKQICVVSSELHGRDNTHLWSLLNDFKQYDRLMLCTDFPDKAKKYFKV